MSRSGFKTPRDLLSPMDRALLWLDRLTQALNVVGTLLIVALMLLIGADVGGRNLMGAPVAGVPELVSLSIVAIVFLQVPQALRAGRLTRSDGLLNALARARPGLARVMETVFDAIAIAVIGALAWASWPIFLRDFERGTFIGAVGDFTAPLWPVKLVIVLGCVALIAQFAARMARRWTGRRPEGPAP